VFTPEQKHDMIDELTETTAATEGEPRRIPPGSTIEETRSGWSVGGEASTTQDLADLQAS